MGDLGSIPEDPLEKGMATHSSILAWRIPMDRGASWATVHGAAKNWTWLKWQKHNTAYTGGTIRLTIITGKTKYNTPNVFIWYSKCIKIICEHFPSCTFHSRMCQKNTGRNEGQLAYRGWDWRREKRVWLQHKKEHHRESRAQS